jgi:hypothetical protein
MLQNDYFSLDTSGQIESRKQIGELLLRLLKFESYFNFSKDFVVRFEAFANQLEFSLEDVNIVQCIEVIYPSQSNPLLSVSPKFFDISGDSDYFYISNIAFAVLPAGFHILIYKLDCYLKSMACNFIIADCLFLNKFNLEVVY